MPDSDRDVLVGYIVIEALNAWASFCRAFFLSCMLEATIGSKRRVRVGHQALSLHDALGIAVRQFKPGASPNAAGIWHRRDEPTWHDPSVLLTLSRTIRCSELPKIEAALSLGATVFSGLPVFRNFFAHRNQGTAMAAKGIAPRYLIPSALSPHEILLYKSVTTRDALMSMWLDELLATVDLLCR